MAYLYINSAHTASAGQSVTGSIVKIQALHKANVASTYQTASIENIVYGMIADPYVSSSGTSTNLIDADTKLTFGSGDCIDGPIIRFKVSAGSNDVLVYTGR